MKNILIKFIIITSIILISFSCKETKKETKYIEKELNLPEAPENLIAQVISSTQINTLSGRIIQIMRSDLKFGVNFPEVAGF